MKLKSCLVALLATTALAATAGTPAESIKFPNGYTKLVFQDEFKSDGLPDSKRWTYECGYVRNGEKQYYTNGRIENCFQKDGMLHIVARNDSARIDGKICPVTSASLTTSELHNWKYCYVEVRAKLPSFRGSWPAIWMMPQHSVYGNWPKSGEIDIMEHVGYAPENVHFAAHCEKFNHAVGIQKNHSEPIANIDSQFHTYALEWTEDRLTWLVDGVEYFTVTKPEGNWESWPYDQPFYLILNLAVGGGWGGQKGVDYSAMPQTYTIDYVRIFQ